MESDTHGTSNPPVAQAPTDTGESQPVRIDRGSDEAPFVWQATVTFTTTYPLPDGVVEAAIVRAINVDSVIKVDELRRMHVSDIGRSS